MYRSKVLCFSKFSSSQLTTVLQKARNPFEEESADFLVLDIKDVTDLAGADSCLHAHSLTEKWLGANV